MVVIDEGVRGPETLPQLFPRHHLARSIEKVEEDLQRLPLQARAALAVLAQFSCADIQFINSEAEDAILVRSSRHSLRLPRN